MSNMEIAEVVINDWAETGDNVALLSHLQYLAERLDALEAMKDQPGVPAFA